MFVQVLSECLYEGEMIVVEFSVWFFFGFIGGLFGWVIRIFIMVLVV